MAAGQQSWYVSGYRNVSLNRCSLTPEMTRARESGPGPLGAAVGIGPTRKRSPLEEVAEQVDRVCDIEGIVVVVVESGVAGICHPLEQHCEIGDDISEVEHPIHVGIASEEHPRLEDLGHDFTTGELRFCSQQPGQSRCDVGDGPFHRRDQTGTDPGADGE